MGRETEGSLPESERGDEGIDAAVPGCYEFLAAGAAGFLAEPAALVFPSLQRQATSLCGQLQRLAEILVRYLIVPDLRLVLTCTFCFS